MVQGLIPAPAGKPNLDMVGVTVHISRATLPAVANGFTRLSAAGDGAPLFAATEQAVVQQNKAKGVLFASAIYPDEGTLTLDYPVIRLSHGTDEIALVTAADLFEQQLRSAAAKSRFSAVGLRDVDGHPLAADAQLGVLPSDTGQLAKATPTQAIETLRLWGAATADVNTLAVIDVSGSMNEPAGNGQSKIAVAAAAAKRALGFFADTSKVGLWVFSTGQSGGSPFAELVPVGLVSDKVGSTTRRQL